MQNGDAKLTGKTSMLASPAPARDTQVLRPPLEREDEAPVRVVVRSRPLNAIEKSDGCRCDYFLLHLCVFCMHFYHNSPDLASTFLEGMLYY